MRESVYERKKLREKHWDKTQREIIKKRHNKKETDSKKHGVEKEQREEGHRETEEK